jgi:cytochrome c
MRALTAALLSAAALHAAAAAPDDAALQKLATDSGCMTCHRIEPGGAGPQGLAPIGPAWREVALRYQGRKNAAEQLVRTVLAGSSPYDSHWKGKVSGLAMPPNAVVLKEPQAKRLVAWILALPPAAKP